jgi:hypothetical protein
MTYRPAVKVGQVWRLDDCADMEYLVTAITKKYVLFKWRDTRSERAAWFDGAEDFAIERWYDQGARCVYDPEDM